MASLETTALLLTAAADLNVVQLIRDAIRTADISSASELGGAGATATVQPTDRFEPRTVITPEPSYAPRQVFHPTPVYLPRPVLHPAPRVEPEPPIQGAPTHKPFAIQPPWQTLPYPKHDAAPAKVKPFVQPPDTHRKGLYIDFFC